MYYTQPCRRMLRNILYFLIVTIHYIFFKFVILPGIMCVYGVASGNNDRNRGKEVVFLEVIGIIINQTTHESNHPHNSTFSI